MKKWTNLFLIAFVFGMALAAQAFALPWEDNKKDDSAYSEESDWTQPTTTKAAKGTTTANDQARVRMIETLAKNPNAFSTASKVARQMADARQKAGAR